MIENMMGFENPVEQGSREDLEIRKLAYERKPAVKRVGSDYEFPGQVFDQPVTPLVENQTSIPS